MAEFFHMGGYALYVWGSFGATAVLLIAEMWQVRKSRQELVKRLKRMQRLEQNK